MTNPSGKQRRGTRKAASSASRSSAQRAFERELKRLWVEDPAVAWQKPPTLEPAAGLRLPIQGIEFLHAASRQATATPMLITAPVTRATLLIRWSATPKGKGSPAFRDPKTGKLRKEIRQLRSVVLPQAVPAHEVRDFILGLGKYRGRKRIAETLGPETSGGKVKLLDIEAVVPRPKSGETASALREYFAERIVPPLLRGRQRHRAERVVLGAMERQFARELQRLMSSPTSRPSSPRRSRGSRSSSSRKPSKPSTPRKRPR